VTEALAIARYRCALFGDTLAVEGKERSGPLPTWHPLALLL